MELIAAHAGTVEQWMRGCKLSCFSSLAFPQDPAVGRACSEDSGESGHRAGRTQMQRGVPCLQVSGQRHMGTLPTESMV